MRTLRCLGLVLFFFIFLPLLNAQQANSKPIQHSQRFAPDVKKERARPAKGDMAKALAQRYAPDRIIVRFRSEVTREQRSQAHAAVGIRQARALRIVPGMEIVRLQPGVKVSAALRQYRHDPNVLYAEPDYRVHHMGLPNDPSFPSLWGLHNTGQDGGTADADIDAPEAWDITTGSSDVVVGVIDTGVDYNHPDLAANIWSNTADCNNNGVDEDGNGYADDCHGINPAYGTSDPVDDYGHGTHVSGTIGAAGNNSLGVVGVNWNVKIAACKFLAWDGYGYDSDAILCLDYFKQLRDRGVNLIATNNSWGGGGYSQALYDAIDAHLQAGILFITAAGNAASDNDRLPNYPSNYALPNIVAVAATTRADELADFSDWGVHTVHLAAPGADILSTFPESLGGQYVWASGTSMATPHVTGVAALLKAQDPTRDWRAIKNLLISSGDTSPAAEQTLSGKRLNAHRALSCSSAELLKRLEPTGGVIVTVPGIPVSLKALHINCASPAGEVTATIDPGATHVTLLDDGVGPDQAAADGVYTAQWAPTATGTYTLSFPGGDTIPLHVLSPYKSLSETYAYRDITSTGTSLDLDSDTYNWVRWIDSPFPVPFGGGSFTHLAVSVFGTISPTDAFQDWDWAPLPAAANTLVAPSWTALWAYAGTQQNVFWAVTGTAPNRELVVEWRNLESYCYQPATITFQAVFFENGSDVLFNYKDMVVGIDSYGNDCSVADDGGAASAGMQVAPNVATQFSYEEPLLMSGTALRWQLGAPSPVLTDLWPFSAAVGDPGFDLEVWGRNFVPSSVVRWNGSARPTRFVNSTYMHAAIPTSDLVTGANVEITVQTPDGGISSARTLPVYSSYPVPAISTLTPNEILVGSGGIWLQVDGTNVVNKSVLRVNGAARQTYPQSPTLLFAYLPGSDFAQAAILDVTVFNPAPGGGESPAAAFTVKNPEPLIYSLQPPFARLSDSPFQLQVSGTGVSSSVVRWNGADRDTTFDGAGVNSISVAAADVAQAGTAQITLYTPPPGGGVSQPFSFDILALPLNDEMAGAIALSPLPFTDTRDIRAATANASDPVSSCNATAGLNSVWYRHDAAASATILLQSSGDGTLSSTISAWTGTPGALTEKACSAFALFQPPQLTLDVVAGTTYWIMVTRPEGLSFGLFTLTATAPASAPVLTAVTPTVIAAGSDATLHATGSAFVSASHLHFDGGDLSSAFVSAAELTANLPATSVLGAHTILVHTPEPGGGVSTAFTVTVTGFALAASPSTATVHAGQSATYTLTATPDSGGFDKAVTFACANPPAGISCSFSTTSGTPGTNPLTTTLTVSTSSTSAANQPGGGAAAYLAWLAMPLFACAGIVLARTPGARWAARCCLLFALVVPMLSCGGGGERTIVTPPRNYTVTVTGSSGTFQKTAAVTLTVQP